MPASPASVSNEQDAAVLVVSPGWLGDSLMAMPAVQAFRRRRPGARILLLAKDRVLELWRMNKAVDECLAYPRPLGILRCEIRARGCREAYMLPNSFRSALPAFVAGVPRRRGAAGHFRRALLTEVVTFDPRPGRMHQACEYLDILMPEAAGDPIERPRLEVPAAAAEAVDRRLKDAAAPRVAFFPGAARGPSKQWPADFFAELGRRLAADPGVQLLLLGTRAERPLCDEMARAVGARTLVLAGELDLPELAAVLVRCQLVVANDSGGMHLASALGAPVLALYGATDPERTGPLGSRGRIIQAEGSCSRAIARNDSAAINRLASIKPERVYQAARECLAAGSAAG